MTTSAAVPAAAAAVVPAGCARVGVSGRGRAVLLGVLGPALAASLVVGVAGGAQAASVTSTVSHTTASTTATTTASTATAHAASSRTTTVSSVVSAGKRKTVVVRPSSLAGAGPVGSAVYPVPVGALFVSPAGDDSAAGTVGAPLASLGRALLLAPAGGTIVLRAGSYHESVNTSAVRPVTIQNYPGEQVWLDGSSPVSAVADGARWRVDGYTQRFDHSPTYTPGAPDNTTPGWSFTNAAYPMAAYPDQVFLDGVSQQQVQSAGQVTAGTFWVDTANSRLYLGSDPTGHQLRVSDLQQAISLRGTDSTLRGIGIRRYATSVPQLGTVRALADRDTLSQLTVTDNATQGVFVDGTAITADHLTLTGNGLMGMLANWADQLHASALRVTGNNDEHFNTSPAAGGLKITSSRDVTVRDSVLSANNGDGLWADCSTYNATFIGNDLIGNAVHGISYEISSHAMIADNIFAGNGQTGLKINNADAITILNNTFTGNGYKPLWIVQDTRQASNRATSGHDSRQAFPDPTMTWTLANISIHNNIFGPTTSSCLLCVEDAALHRSATTIGITTDNNIYNRATTTQPTWLTIWASGATNPFTYTTLTAMHTATGQETHSVELTGPTQLTTTYQPTTTITTLQTSHAQPLDTPTATLLGHTPGEHHLGAWN